MLKLGVLGVGAIATVDYGVLPNLHHIADKVELVALCDPVEERTAAAAKKYGAREVYATLDEMLDESDIDLVLNLTPIPAHGPTSLKILEAGKHLATEKPLATTMEDADALIEMAAANGLKIVCSPPNMLYPSRIEAARLIREGVVGKVAFAKVRASHGGPASMMNWPTDPSWFYQEGSGPLFDVGVYGIHEMLGLLGPAQRGLRVLRHHRADPGGALGAVRRQGDHRHDRRQHPDHARLRRRHVRRRRRHLQRQRRQGPRLEVFGRKGTLNLPNNLPVNGGRGIDLFLLEAAAGLSGWVDLDLAHLEPAQQRVDKLRRALLVDHLADVVNGTAEEVMGGDVARHALEIMLKAHESARTGQALELTTTFSR